MWDPRAVNNYVYGNLKGFGLASQEAWFDVLAQVGGTFTTSESYDPRKQITFFCSS